MINTNEKKPYVVFEVQLYTGLNDPLLETHDVQFVVNLHSENKATQGKCT